MSHTVCLMYLHVQLAKKHKYLIKIYKCVLLWFPTLHHFQYISDMHFILGDNTLSHSVLCKDLCMLVLLCY